MKKDSEVQGSELDEMSIFRSQQMDKVTVPIKIRAIYKGFITGYADISLKHDNSWWESFGGARASHDVTGVTDVAWWEPLGGERPRCPPTRTRLRATRRARAHAATRRARAHAARRRARGHVARTALDDPPRLLCASPPARSSAGWQARRRRSGSRFG